MLRNRNGDFLANAIVSPNCIRRPVSFLRFRRKQVVNKKGLTFRFLVHILGLHVIRNESYRPRRSPEEHTIFPRSSHRPYSSTIFPAPSSFYITPPISATSPLNDFRVTSFQSHARFSRPPLPFLRRVFTKAARNPLSLSLKTVSPPSSTPSSP